jgi:hypothetical protein
MTSLRELLGGLKDAGVKATVLSVSELSREDRREGPDPRGDPEEGVEEGRQILPGQDGVRLFSTLYFKVQPEALRYRLND